MLDGQVTPTNSSVAAASAALNSGINAGLQSLNLSVLSSSIFTSTSSSPFTPGNYAPAPPINSSTVLNYPLNTNDVYLTSQKIEIFRINYGTNTTDFDVQFLNRSASGNITEYSIPGKAGHWVAYAQTFQSLSCVLVAETTLKQYGFIQFLQNNKSFLFLATMNASKLGSSYATMDQQYVKANTILGDGCLTGSFANVIYKMSADYTTLNAVTVPTGWQTQNISESFVYGISQQNLYKYDANSNQYKSLYSLQAYNNYSIWNYQNRLVIQGQNSTLINATSNTYSNKMTLYCFVDDPTAGLVSLLANYY